MVDSNIYCFIKTNPPVLA